MSKKEERKEERSGREKERERETRIKKRYIALPLLILQ